MQAVKKLNIVTSPTATMKAIVHCEYGDPEGLKVIDVGIPVARYHEVLIRFIAAGASIGDHHIITGKPYLVRLNRFGGFPRPKHKVPGAAMEEHKDTYRT